MFTENTKIRNTIDKDRYQRSHSVIYIGNEEISKKDNIEQEIDHPPQLLRRTRVSFIVTSDLLIVFAESYSSRTLLYQCLLWLEKFP